MGVSMLEKGIFREGVIWDNVSKVGRRYVWFIMFFEFWNIEYLKVFK